MFNEFRKNILIETDDHFLLTFLKNSFYFLVYLKLTPRFSENLLKMKNIQVKIFGSVYSFKSENNSKQKIVNLSKELSELMNKHACKMNNINPLEISILTALNLLEENHSLKSKLSKDNL